ncbi:MAG: hypothetical protein IKK33_08370 [Lachnospiraceae bacterium]|nr:hypothetical protein [Lachnospiraceae bacterium]
MKWIVIEGFIPDLEEHIKLLDGLISKKTIVLVRKEYLEFEELEEAEKCEIIEEDYELFKEGLLWFPSHECREILERKICEITQQIPELSVENNNIRIDFILTKLEEYGYNEQLQILKEIIVRGIVDYTKSKSVLNSKNHALITELNESYKYFESNGMLEGEQDYYEWYQVEHSEELKKYIQENHFCYNIMLIENDVCKYYVNYYEGEDYVLAVRDNTGDFIEKFLNIFPTFSEKLTMVQQVQEEQRLGYEEAIRKD